MYLQIYDDPEAEIFTIDTLRISVNGLYISGFETLHKKIYSENSTMIKFRMIPEPYLVHVVSTKV